MMGMTEEEVKELEARAAWVDAQRAAEARTGIPSSFGIDPPAPAVPPGGMTEAGGSSQAPPPAPAPLEDSGPKYGGGSREIDTSSAPFEGADAVSAPYTTEAAHAAAFPEGGGGGPPPDEGGGGGGGDPPPAGGGGGGVVIPGGMQPYMMKTEAKLGKPVSPEVRRAYGAASGLELEGAAIQHDAHQALVQQEANAATRKLAASDLAIQQHAALQQERDNVVRDRLAEIEDLNREATGKPEDLWTPNGGLGRLISFLFSTLGAVTIATGGGSKGSLGAGLAMGMGGKFVDGLINDDIQSKLAARKAAGDQAKRQTDLLHLHLDNMDSQQKAIDATKLAYYDNVLQQMEGFRAENKGKVDDAAYLNLQADILKLRAKTENDLNKQETAEVTQEFVQKMRPPQVVGGGAAGAHLQDVPNTITLSDGTTWAMGDGPQTDKAVERIKAMQKLQEVNQRIKSLRQQAYKLDPLMDKTEYGRIYADLENLGAQKAPLMSMALDGSTIRKDERDEIEKKNVHATEGLGQPGVPYSNKIPGWSRAHQVASDSVLDSQTSLWQKNQKIEASGAGARQVQRGYVHDEKGEKRPVARYTGKDARPDERLPPDSFKSDDPAVKTSTRGRPLSESFAPAPDFGYQPRPAPAAGGKRKKKDQ